MENISTIQDILASVGYVSDDQINTAIYLAKTIERPILIEGAAGVGKTFLAKSIASALSLPLVRLQCYEGLTLEQSVYEWNYPLQIMKLQATKDTDWNNVKCQIFSQEYLLERPLLKAARIGECVLLIDEVDKSDAGFESFLLEFLDEYQITIPEIGTLAASNCPISILTSNRTRELGDALRRRCIHLFLNYPNVEKEKQILQANVPNADEKLIQHVQYFASVIRKTVVQRPPGMSEIIDWLRALVSLKIDGITPEIARLTIGVVVKNTADAEAVLKEVASNA